MKRGMVCHDPGGSGLAASRRTPEDEAGNLFRVDQTPQKTIGTDKMLLPDDLIQFFRAQTIRQRPPRKRSKQSGFFEHISAIPE